MKPWALLTLTLSFLLAVSCGKKAASYGEGYHSGITAGDAWCKKTPYSELQYIPGKSAVDQQMQSCRTNPDLIYGGEWKRGFIDGFKAVYDAAPKTNDEAIQRLSKDYSRYYYKFKPLRRSDSAW